jgi:hypothetical protein
MSGTRWSIDQVLALTSDHALQRAARGLTTASSWQEAGYSAEGDQPVVWGLCRGSATHPYQVCADLSGPAYRCACPSRKVPCKHALGLLLRWAQGAFDAQGAIDAQGSVDAGEPPTWVKEWQATRAAQGGRSATTRRGPVSERSQTRRAERVAAGLDELDRWLADQVRSGLAGLSRAGYAHWETMAARLIDAQAPGAAGAVRRLASAAADPGGERLLAELALLRLLVAAYRRIDKLPEDVAATVRARVGFTVPADEVLALPPVRDEWQVLGLRDQEEERFTTRRIWLRGTATGRFALVLSFAAPGQPLLADLVVGTTVDADLCFFPGALPLRALVATRHSEARPSGAPPGPSISDMLFEYAKSLAAEPWLDRWPVLVAGALAVAGGRWHVLDEAGDAVPLDRATGEPWRLIAAAGGRPLTIAGEWSTAGLRPVTGWVEGRLVRC